MRRRDLLAGVGSLGVLLGGGVLATRGVPTPGSDSPAPPEDLEPVEISTVDAPGSEEGTLTVPAAGQILVVDFFATTCRTCQELMPTLAEANEAASDSATFLSVTLESNEQDIREFWETYDADWLVGIDLGIDLYPQYEVVGTPTTVILDGEGAVHWRSEGTKTVEELLDGIDAARDAALE